MAIEFTGSAGKHNIPSLDAAYAIANAAASNVLRIDGEEERRRL